MRTDLDLRRPYQSREAAVAVSGTTVEHVFDGNTHNTHLYDENEILLLLFQLYFEAKTASSELFVFSRIVTLTISIWPNT